MTTTKCDKEGCGEEADYCKVRIKIINEGYRKSSHLCAPHREELKELLINFGFKD